MLLRPGVDRLEIRMSQPRAEQRARTHPLRIILRVGKHAGCLKIAVLFNDRLTDPADLISQPEQHVFAGALCVLQHVLLLNNPDLGDRDDKFSAPTNVLLLLVDDFIQKIPRKQQHIIRLIID